MASIQTNQAMNVILSGDFYQTGTVTILSHAESNLEWDASLSHECDTISVLGRAITDAYGLMSYGVSYQDMHRRAATFVDKFWKAQSPRSYRLE